MPTLLKLCNYAGCGSAAVKGSTYCPAHKAQRDAAWALRKNLSGGKRRPSARQMGYDSQWEKVRRMHLRGNPVCVACGAPGEHVDHIVPMQQDPSRRLDMTNLQTLCRPCHSRKTARENRGSGGRFMPRAVEPEAGGGRGSAKASPNGFGNGVGGQKHTRPK